MSVFWGGRDYAHSLDFLRKEGGRWKGAERREERELDVILEVAEIGEREIK